jgi:translocation and assembly module TamA
MRSSTLGWRALLPGGTARAFPALRDLAVVALTGMTLLLAAPTAQAGIQLEVTAAEGVLPAAAKANVLVYLSLSRYRTRDDLDPLLVMRLQARAAREARAALRPFGFYQATAAAYVRPIDGSAGQWTARVRVVPGPRVRWAAATVRITGPGAEESYFKDAVSRHPLPLGAPLEHATYDALKGDLQRLAASLGYLEARFTRAELTIDPVALTASAAVELDTGPRYHFGAVSLQQEVLEPTLVRRFIRWHEGDPFDAALLLGTQFVLDDSLYFAGVEVVPGEPDQATRSIPVTLQLTAARRRRYALSIGYATDTAGRATARWENHRLNPRGHRARANLQWGTVSRDIGMVYSLPVGDPALEEVSATFGLEEARLADARTAAMALGATLTQVRGAWQQVLGLTANRSSSRSGDTRTTDTLIVPSLRLASAPQGLARAAMAGGGRPWMGTAGGGSTGALLGEGLQAELEGSAAALGSGSGFLRLRVRDEQHHSLGTQWRWIWRAELGTTLVKDFDRLPVQYRFFAGGDRSVRGFAMNDLGPRDAQGLRTGGKHLVAASVEFERALPGQFAVAAFVDTGNAFNSAHAGFATAVGVGVRYRLPVISIGIDLAQAIRVPGGSALPGPRIHLSLVPVF